MSNNLNIGLINQLQIDAYDKHGEVDMYKFAELIIRECNKAIRIDYDKYESHYVGYKLKPEDCQQAILSHFYQEC